MGVAVVTLDQDFDGGELAEQPLDLAVAKDGTVLYVGSYTESYEGGQFVNSTDAWLSGVNGAESGTFMPAVPRVGMPAFRQALVPGEGAVTAEVVKTSQRMCVPTGASPTWSSWRRTARSTSTSRPEWAAS